MRKLLVLILLITSIAAPIFSQNNVEQTINERLDLYFQATKEKRWGDLVELIYPKLFEKVSKEDMITLFEDMEGNGIKLDMKGFKADQISDAFTQGAENFALVDYSAIMVIQLTSQSDQDPEMAALFKNSFDTTYGEGNVIYHQENNSFEISVNKSMFAISEKGKNNWTFIESDAAQTPGMETIIPAEVKAHFLE